MPWTVTLHTGRGGFYYQIVGSGPERCSCGGAALGLALHCGFCRWKTYHEASDLKTEANSTCF
ncbi:hypothetical protein Hanom_Chr10g00876691 [Helianthus anomalus]